MARVSRLPFWRFFSMIVSRSLRQDGKIAQATWYDGSESCCCKPPGSIGRSAPTGAIMKFEKLGNFKPCSKLAGAR
jgi:hypothetical protein